MLDTNVLSELGKPDINESVDAWSRRHENDPFFISAVSVAEIKSGLPFMQEGRKKRAMAEILDKHIRRGGCLPFDESCAPHYTAILVQKGWGRKPRKDAARRRT